jgi:rhodanese-related sulfurtransferase
MKAEEAYKLIIENKKLLILDVRTKEEYEKGHIPGAKLIPVQALSARMDELYEYQDSPILVYCETGRRSSFAVNYLIENDFTEIYHLDRGIVAWKYDRALG